MLTWEKTAPNTVVAHLNGYSYTITEDEDEEVWGVEITDPDGGVMTEVCDSIEEAKEFCENTASEVQAED
ncbi:MAG TPA: hypothetical protein VF990_05585 [Candidatus Dormibacteraeota bacterium]|jgi:hypothetical protein|uniref:hypothetical protein n=1 Tax=Mycobacterium sp. TaxID=1785 RepID=UPI002EE4C3FD